MPADIIQVATNNNVTTFWTNWFRTKWTFFTIENIGRETCKGITICYMAICASIGTLLAYLNYVIRCCSSDSFHFFAFLQVGFWFWLR